tara:strand:+ start:440 stop:694 length:255 start_codon:yes stop_codon:yes gene_type:complete
MAVKESAPETTHNIIVAGLAREPKVERAKISVLSNNNRITLAKNKPVSNFVGSFKALSQFASKMITLLWHCFYRLTPLSFAFWL